VQGTAELALNHAVSGFDVTPLMVVLYVLLSLLSWEAPEHPPDVPSNAARSLSESLLALPKGA
jgi:hypothetical protein